MLGNRWAYFLQQCKTTLVPKFHSGEAEEEWLNLEAVWSLARRTTTVAYSVRRGNFISRSCKDLEIQAFAYSFSINSDLFGLSGNVLVPSFPHSSVCKEDTFMPAFE